VLKKKHVLLILVSLHFCIAFLSLASLSKLPKIKVEQGDKYGHFVLYFLLAVVWYLFLKSKSLKHFSAIVSSFILSVVFGFILEVFQEVFTTNRMFEWADVMANTLGSLTALVLMFFLKLRLNAKAEQQ
jgi:VanZ family protein